MPIAYALSQKGTLANELETKASVSVDITKGGITGIELKRNAKTIEGLCPMRSWKLPMHLNKTALFQRH
jgi:hypothetical protein